MSAAETPTPKELTPQEMASLLQRVLKAVEKDKRTRWVEITCAVVLSLATMSSAWCAYQATLWGGVQTFRLAAAQKAGKPWVLDPIAAGGLPWRGGIAAELLAFKPAVVRGNASEIIGLAGLEGLAELGHGIRDLTSDAGLLLG